MKILQIGCADCSDDVFSFVSANASNISKFMVVDATPESINIARDKYEFLGERLISVCCAVGDENQISEMFIPTGGIKGCHGHSSLSKEHVIRHLHHDIDKIYVPVMRVNQLLGFVSKGERLDFLFVDCEGLDAKIINDIDLARFEIGEITFEYTHSDGPFKQGENLKNALENLRKHDYVEIARDMYNLKFKKKSN